MKINKTTYIIVIAIIAVTGVAILAVNGSFTTAQLSGNYDKEDLNMDGIVDTNDAYLLMKHVIGGDDLPTNVDADFNNDGKVDNEDMLILYYFVEYGTYPTGG